MISRHPAPANAGGVPEISRGLPQAVLEKALASHCPHRRRARPHLVLVGRACRPGRGWCQPPARRHARPAKALPATHQSKNRRWFPGDETEGDLLPDQRGFVGAGHRHALGQ